MYINSGRGFFARYEDDLFVFGAEYPPVENRVTRAVAIYLICGTLTYEKLENHSNCDVPILPANVEFSRTKSPSRSSNK
jgi:hypothetical protein